VLSFREVILMRVRPFRVSVRELAIYGCGY
jgi:hypothetical protein